MPFKATQLLMDIGVVDANGDDWLDVFTTNHNYRQDLLIADGKGGYRDTLSAWGLDQNLEFPGFEIALSEPEVVKPGALHVLEGKKDPHHPYAQDQGRRAAASQASELYDYQPLRRQRIRGRGARDPASGSQQMPEHGDGVDVRGDGELDMEIETPGTPIGVQLDGTVPLTSVYIGRQKISPRSKQFELTFQDRHGMAWADYNDDGLMDIFITRGALSGQLLRMLPEDVSSGIQDELIVSDGPRPVPEHVATEVGIDKRGCSGRKVNWVDFNRDGLLDLFINCQDRGNVYVRGKLPQAALPAELRTSISSTSPLKSVSTFPITR